jgi:drug/metabolite transporter (DMT)-like permease
LAAILAAASGVVVRAFPRSHPLATNAAGMGTGAILLLALTFGTSTPTAVPALASTWLAFAWLVGSSIVAFAIMVHLIAQWGPTRTSYSAVLAPLVTAIVATWLADESITAGLASGGVLVLGGVYMGLSGNVKP